MSGGAPERGRARRTKGTGKLAVPLSIRERAIHADRSWSWRAERDRSEEEREGCAKRAEGRGVTGPPMGHARSTVQTRPGGLRGDLRGGRETLVFTRRPGRPCRLSPARGQENPSGSGP